MASIQKKQNKKGTVYRFTVSCGVDDYGRQIRKTKTWKPSPGMTAFQADKAAKIAAADFERLIEYGYSVDTKLTFEEFALHVLEVKKIEGYEDSTMTFCKRALKNHIFPRIGHMKLTAIRPQHLNKLYQEMMSSKRKSDLEDVITMSGLKPMLYEMGLTQTQIAKAVGLSTTTVNKIVKPGSRVARRNAQKVADYLKINLKDYFEPLKPKELSPNYIVRIHSLVSEIFKQAEKEMIITINPAKRVSLPSMRNVEKRRNYFQPGDEKRILAVLENEPIKWRAFINVLAVTGIRLGEAIGLKWEKVDFDKNEILIDRAVKYDGANNLYEGTTKTGRSRYVAVPPQTMNLLKKYRVWQTERRLFMGDIWQGAPYVFCNETGGTLNPTTVYSYMQGLSKKYNLPHLNPHAFRHSAASIMITSGVDIVTVSKMLGHKDVTTTLNIYAHAINEASRNASDTMAQALLSVHAK